MKTILLAILAAVVLTGCFAPYKKNESVHERKTFHENGELATYEIRRDRSKGGGPALLVDPKVAQINSQNVNQNALGGGSSLRVGELTGTNRPDALDAAGNAGGKIIGRALGVPDLDIGGENKPPIDIPGVPVVRRGDTVYKREPDVYSLGGKLFRFDGEKMTPVE